jgi:S-adenosylmethionine decarboxylase
MMNAFLPGLNEAEAVHGNATPILGSHLLGEWYGCPRTDLLRRADKLRSMCLQRAREARMEVVGEVFHQFTPEGVTGTLLLAESHLAIHTWPESGFVTIDVYVCNERKDNRAKALLLFRSIEEMLAPTWTHSAHITRGLSDDESPASGQSGLGARL